MILAPFIERYMDLRREESAVCQEYYQLQDAPLPVEDYNEVRTLLNTSSGILNDPEQSALHQPIVAIYAEYTALLVAMGNLLLEEGKRLKEMQDKLTEIKRKKHQIKVLLQQM